MGKPVDGLLEWQSIFHHGHGHSIDVDVDRTAAETDRAPADRGGERSAEDEPARALAGWIRRHGTARDLRAQVTLFTQDHACGDLYWIERGWVTLLRSEDTGRDVIIGFRTAGALLGTSALAPGGIHPLTAMTRTSARVWTISLDALDEALDADPLLRRAILECLARESAERAARCGALGCLDAREHLERLLLQQFAAGHLGAGPARIPLSTGEIAGFLGIDLSHACRLLRAMRREGLIDVTRGWIVIRDLARLEARRA